MRKIGVVLIIFATVVSGRTARADDLLPRVEELTRQVTPRVIEWRRDFHGHPELSNQEERTSQVVAKRLKEIGVDEIKTGVARHGVVALIRGAKPGPTVALRADMDALPIEEATGLPFASQNPGAMHACGHDAHTAMLLGAASVLVQMRDSIAGNVKLIFQPAEEGAPAGDAAGANLMVKEGVLENPPVAAIFGLHVSTEADTGQLTTRPGALMAGVDHFRVTVIGKQSHGAMPWQGIDPIVASAQIISALQTIRSRRVDTRRPIVVSVGIVRGGTAWNIIPERVTLEGTIRTHDAQIRSLASDEFRRIVTQTAAALGANVEIEFSDYGPALENDAHLVEQMRPTLARVVGEQGAIEAEPVMGGEDFARFAEKVPGMFVFIGVHDPASQARTFAHSPTFTIDENALPIGVRTHVMLALDYLRAQTK